MKGSALRRWLRQERAREHAAWLERPMWQWVDVRIGEPNDMYTARIQVPRSLRAPEADVHVHGRDCAMVTRRLRQGVWWRVAIPRATCGVDGVYAR